ncbi:MAG: hypothetical protein ABIP75_15880 [Pyrinomonadaceae bacterium]
MPTKKKPPTVDSALQITRIIWGAFVMTQGLFFILAVTQPGAKVPSDPVVIWALLAVAMMLGPVSWVVKNRLLAQAAEKQVIQGVQQAIIVAVAICEVASILGVIAHFMFGSKFYFLFFIVAVLAILSHFPSRAQFEAAAGTKPIV